MAEAGEVALVRYIVTADGAEEVSDRTARPHRALFIDQRGDAIVYPVRGSVVPTPLLQISAAELTLIARHARRAARRRFWRRITGRR